MDSWVVRSNRREKGAQLGESQHRASTLKASKVAAKARTKKPAETVQKNEKLPGGAIMTPFPEIKKELLGLQDTDDHICERWDRIA